MSRIRERAAAGAVLALAVAPERAHALHGGAETAWGFALFGLGALAVVALGSWLWFRLRPPR